MKDFFKHNGLWVLFAAAVISVALATLSFFAGASSPLVNGLNVLASPFRAMCSNIADWFNDKQNYYRDTTALQQENEDLRRRVAEMEEAVRQAESDSEENKFLRSLLELREQRRDLTDFETARITEHTVTNWTSSLTLDKGTAQGVEKGDCVIDGTGALVGIVSQTGMNWSTVLTLADTDTSLGAQVFRTKDLGLAQGDFALMERGLLRLDYLPADCQLLSGDLVVTSGLGGYYPAGMVIGRVQEVLPDDSGAASYALIAPQTDPDTLTEVAVIKSFDIVT